MFITSKWFMSMTQAPASLQPLPPEIIDRIIGQLSIWDYDKSALLQCSLVSPSFRHFSQSRLFEGITLSTEHKDRTNSLYIILYNNPHLSSHIHKLTLSSNPGDAESYAGSFGGLQDDLLPDVMMKLRSLTSLNFIGGIDSPNSWGSLTLKTQQALLYLGHGARIATIEFDETREWPISFLHHFPYLKHIRLNTSWDPFMDDAKLDEPSKISRAAQNCCELRLKELYMKYALSPVLLSYIRGSQLYLRVLAVYSDDAAYTSLLEGLVRSSTASLKKLKIYHDPERDTNSGLSQGTLGGLTDLRGICVQGYNIDACKSLIALLKNTAGTSPIEEISVKFHGVDIPAPCSFIVWEELNECFKQHLNFGLLHTVYIELETSMLWQVPTQHEDPEMLGKFLSVFSCFQANPHIFHITGADSPNWSAYIEEEHPSWFRSLRRLLPI